MVVARGIYHPTGREYLRFLVAEDDRALGAFLARGLEAEGHQVIVAADGIAAMDLFQREIPDLIVLDLNLPRRDGMEVLRFLRSVGSESPVLVLTARTELEVRVQCLDLGADDCMVKPFALAELRARCRALLRRRRNTSFMLRHGELEINRMERSVSYKGQAIILTNKELALLECLLLQRGRIVSRSTLLEQVWNTHAATSTNVVDVYVNYLRRKLSDAGAETQIQTMRGEGYSIGFRA
jgi:DNA-binding response OmpR family regulator